MNHDDILSISNLTMRFSGLLALNKVSLTVKRGSISALIGPNGAGKTTLFNCLTGFYLAKSGELLFQKDNRITDIQKIAGFPLFGGSHLCSRVGIARTFQNSRLFKEMTVMENLLVAQHKQSCQSLVSGVLNTKQYRATENRLIKVAVEWLDRFNLTNEANQLAGKLAYGKQRHVEIARAMCTNPALLCLDEPAAGLNPVETQELCNTILNLQKENNVTILLIEHDMSLVMNICDHIVVLDHGEVICAGNPLDVRHDKRVIEAYLGLEHV